MKTWIYIVVLIFSLLFSAPHAAIAADSCAPLNIKLSPSQDFEIPISNGEGCAEGSVFSLLSISIEGTGSIISPEAGTWKITAENNGNPFSFNPSNSGITSTDTVQWQTKAKGFSKNKIKFNVSWSEKENTTLKIHLNANL